MGADSVWPKASAHRSLGQRPRTGAAREPLLAEGPIHAGGGGTSKMAYGQRRCCRLCFLGRCPRLTLKMPSAKTIPVVRAGNNLAKPIPPKLGSFRLLAAPPATLPKKSSVSRDRQQLVYAAHQHSVRIGPFGLLLCVARDERPLAMAAADRLAEVIHGHSKPSAACRALLDEEHCGRHGSTSYRHLQKCETHPSDKLFDFTACPRHFKRREPPNRCEFMSLGLSRPSRICRHRATSERNVGVGAIVGRRKCRALASARTRQFRLDHARVRQLRIHRPARTIVAQLISLERNPRSKPMPRWKAALHAWLQSGGHDVPCRSAWAPRRAG